MIDEKCLTAGSRANGYQKSFVNELLKKSALDRKASPARALAIGGGAARIVQFQHGQHQLAEQAAANPAMGEQTQKRSRLAVDFDAHRAPPVVELRPSLRHADPAARRNQ